jgi:hypothetical protein
VRFAETPYRIESVIGAARCDTLRDVTRLHWRVEGLFREPKVVPIVWTIGAIHSSKSGRLTTQGANDKGQMHLVAKMIEQQSGQPSGDSGRCQGRSKKKPLGRGKRRLPPTLQLQEKENLGRRAGAKLCDTVVVVGHVGECAACWPGWTGSSAFVRRFGAFESQPGGICITVIAFD